MWPMPTHLRLWVRSCSSTVLAAAGGGGVLFFEMSVGTACDLVSHVGVPTLISP